MPSRLHFEPLVIEQPYHPKNISYIHFGRFITIPITPIVSIFEAFNDGLGNSGRIAFNDGLGNSGRILVVESPAQALLMAHVALQQQQETYNALSLIQKISYQIKKPFITLMQRIRRK